jgi:hypothetical protein
VIRWALKQFVSWQARKVQASMLRPREAQEATFARLQALLRGTGGSRASGFERCRTLDEVRGLPPSDSESLKPTLTQIFTAGVRGLIGRARLHGFMRTSGSRGEPKLIPIDSAYLASLDRTLMRMVCSQVFTSGQWDTPFNGRHVFLSSRPKVGASPSGLPVFDASALYPTRASWFVRWMLLPRHADLWLDDWGLKSERILEQARGKNVLSFNGIPALAIDFARRAKERYGVRHLDEVWPSLRHLSYGGIGLPRAQKEELKRSWFSPGHAFTFYETYFASEAPLGFAFDARDDALALNTLENLYVFRDGDDMLLADELKSGARYALHVTTPGGLVNFRMGDLVEVVSPRPLLIRVAGREGEELSLTGEKITVAQVDLALAAAGVQAGVHLPVVWKVDGERPHLVWGVPDSLTADAARLDDALCSANVLYAEALRYEHVVGPSQVERISVARFEAHRSARLGNYKPKRLFESREAFEQWISGT